MVLSIIVAIIGLLIIVEGFIVFVNPKWTKKMMLKMAKKQNRLRLIGFIELVVGVILFLIAVSMRGY